MPVDGSVVIQTDLDISDADKELAKLKKKIMDTAKTASELQGKRDEAAKRSVFSAAELDAEKAKLAEMKQELQEMKAIAKDKSLTEAVRAEARAGIPTAQENVAEQTQRVRLLQTEYNRIASSVERYETQLSEATANLETQKTQAGTLVQRIDEVNKSSGRMTKALERAGESVNKFSDRFVRLAKRVFVFSMITMALRGLRSMLSNVIKTNDDARAALARLKGALLTLAQPLINVLIPAFTQLINVLATVVRAAADVVAALFGTTGEQAAADAEKLYEEQQAIEGVGSAAKKAGGQLAGFDEINQLAGENAESAGSGSVLGDIKPDFTSANKLADKLKDIKAIVLEIAGALALWKIGSSLTGSLSGLGRTLQGIAGGLSVAAGLTLLVDNIQAILAGEYKNVSKESFIKNVLSGLLTGIGLVAMGASGWAIPIALGLTFVVSDIATNWEKGFGDEGIFDNAFDAAKALFRGNVADFWEEANQAFTDYVSTDSWLGKIWIWLFDLVNGKGSWDKLVEAVVNGDITLKDALEHGGFSFLSDLIGWLADWLPKLQTKAAECVQGLQKAWGWFDENVVTPVKDFWAWLSEKFNWLKGMLEEKVIKPATEMSLKIGTKVNELKDGIVTAFQGGAILVQAAWKGISGWFTEKVWQPLESAGETADLKIIEYFSNCWKSIKDIWGKVGSWFSTNVTGKINEAFGKIDLRTPVNNMLDKMEKGINGIISLVNKFISGFNGIVSKAASFIGQKWSGIPTIKNVTIPRLAQGTVIPPNREFMAVLGDQTSGTNVEAPLDTIKQALVEALRESGGSGGDIHITLELDGSVVARKTVKHINDMTRQAGKPVLLY